VSRRTSVPPIDLIEAIADAHLFGPGFTPGAHWRAWRVVIKALFGLRMTPSELEIFQRGTGRTTPPTQPAREAWLVIGRRGGKSRIAALISVYLACFKDYRPILAPGERGVVMVLASDREQARVVFGYIEALLDQVPMLKALVVHQTREEIHLRHRVVIRVHTASFRAVRGYTIIGTICDEIAFWRSEDSANPDVEILHALRPAMSTVADPLLLCISSPYARKGALWEAYHRHYGHDGDPVLVWQADTQSMNPVVDPQVIADAYQADPAAARAEYGAEFRTDIETFLSREIVEACIERGVSARPPRDGCRYTAFVDPSGGVGDSFALALAHAEGDDVVLDLVHERRAPLSPEDAVREFVGLLKPYRVREVVGDRYSEELVRELFRKQGVSYEVSRWTKSDLFVELLPLLTSRRARLLDQPRLVAQLLSLERRTGGSGKDLITHPRDGHDDVANACAGSLVHAACRGQPGFEGWKPYVPEPVSARPVRPVTAVEVIERASYRCPTPGCGWEDGAPVDPAACPACHPKGPSWQEALRGY
jgi:hypothetical protein